MKLEQTVCSLELAKQLKRLRVRQESLYFWSVDRKEPETVILRERPLSKEHFDSYSAYSVAELGEMLCAGIVEHARTQKPKYGILFDQDKCPKWTDGDKKWMIHLAADETYVMDDSEADARARFLVCILERKLVKIREVNSSLGGAYGKKKR